MIRKVKKYFLTEQKYKGAVLFGSQLGSPTSESDTDIVLFVEDSNFVHKIYKIEDELFDAFEMSLEQAFEFVRIRRPLWLSAFSTGINITECEHVDLLLKTAIKVVEDYKLTVDETHLSKLAFSLEVCYKKSCINVDNIFIYTHCAAEFIKAVKRVLFYLNSVKPCPYDQQIAILISDFGNISILIRDFLLENNFPNKHSIASEIYKYTRNLLPEIHYPITI